MDYKHPGYRKLKYTYIADDCMKTPEGDLGISLSPSNMRKLESNAFR